MCEQDLWFFLVAAGMGVLAAPMGMMFMRSKGWKIAKKNETNSI